MAFYKTQDINKEVTLFVKQYLDNGYWFAMDRMNVSYSDAEGTVVLSNGNDYIRIQLVNYYKQPFGHRMDTCNIIVKQSEDKRFWDNTTKVVDEFTFYRINNKTFTDDINVVEKVIKVGAERERNKENFYDCIEIKRYDPDKIIQIVNKRYGYKSCRKSQIKRVTKWKMNGWSKDYYQIDIEGKSNPVCVHIPIQDKHSFERY